MPKRGPSPPRALSNGGGKLAHTRFAALAPTRPFLMRSDLLSFVVSTRPALMRPTCSPVVQIEVMGGKNFVGCVTKSGHDCIIYIYDDSIAVKSIKGTASLRAA